jgi:thiol:disulfide interchange protein DsbD
MTILRPVFATLGLLASLAAVHAAAFADTPPLPGDTLVRARLLLDRHAVAPHRSAVATIELTPAPGWHIYGPERGDAGVPPAIAWKLPHGVRAGAIAFPPARRVAAHGITTYVYTARTALRVPLVAGGIAPRGRDARVVARVTWVACAHVCAPGGATLASTLAIVNSPR